MAAVLRALLLVVALTLLPSAAGAEIRGGAFEVGGIGGGVPWSNKLGLKPCGWFGGFAGHRFEPLAERLYLGFRANWEGCITDQQVTEDRIDMILIDVHFTYGVKATEWLLPYGTSGAGFLIADATPSGGGPTPRTVFQTGGGLLFSIGPHLIVDASVRLLIFENIQFGTIQGQFGTVVSPLFSLAVGAQI